MRAVLAALCGFAGFFLLAPACGGSILLGVNEDAGTSGGAVGAEPAERMGLPVANAIDGGAADAHTQAMPAQAGSTSSNSGPGACWTTTFDPHNCGSCGHDCSGSACRDGVCVPLAPGVLASGQITPSSITVDEANVYWVNEGAVVNNVQIPPQVMKCAKSGCNNNPTVIATIRDSGQPWNNIRGLAVDGQNVYWGSGPYGAPDGLFACAIGGCNNSPTALRQILHFGGIAVNGNQVYAVGDVIVLSEDGGVAGSGPWEVYGCSPEGCDDNSPNPAHVLWSTPQSEGNSAASIIGIAVDTSNAYFASYVDRTILTCSLAGCGGAPTVLAPDGLLLDAGWQGNQMPWQLAVDETNVYWDLTRYWPVLQGPAQGEVLACPKTGCSEGPTVLASGLRNPAGLATDGASVYFTERGTNNATDATDGRVSKCSVTGCSNQPTPVAVNLSYPQGVAVDASHVYWTDLGSDARTVGMAAVTSPNFGDLVSVDGRVMMAPK
jgi:hypothetical protein